MCWLVEGLGVFFFGLSVGWGSVSSGLSVG